MGSVRTISIVFTFACISIFHCIGGVTAKCDSILEPRPLDVSQIGVAFQTTKLVLGRNHSVMMSSIGRLYAWGASGFGRLGIASETRKYVQLPTEIPFFREIELTSVVSGDFHMLALDVESNVYSWGWGAEGQNGFGNAINIKLPRKIDFFDNLNVCRLEIKL